MDELLDLEPLDDLEFELFFQTSGYVTLDGLTPIQAKVLYHLKCELGFYVNPITYTPCLKSQYLS